MIFEQLTLTASQTTTRKRLFTWGLNTSGQLGYVGAASSFAQISSGPSHAIAIDSTGKLWGWGLNTSGQVGDNTAVTKSSPVLISSTANWKTVSAGTDFSIALNTLGQLYAWGLNANYTLGTTDNINRSSPTQIGLSSWSVASAGASHTMAITSTGGLWGWGATGYGQIGQINGSTIAYSWTQISSNLSHTVGLRNDGKLFTWGLNSSGQLGTGDTFNRSSPVQINSVNYNQVSAGLNYTLALTSNNQLFAWGANNVYQLGLGNTITQSSPVQVNTVSYSQISAGLDHALAIDVATNSLWTWGNSSTLPLLYILNTNIYSWTQISTNGTYTLAIRSDSTLWAWGLNSSGQLGVSNTTNYSSPVQVGTSSWTQVVAGSANSLGITVLGRLYAWGLNSTGQLGQNNTTNTNSPVQIGTYSYNQVSAGNSFAVAKRVDGTVWTWGLNANNQLGTGTTINLSSPVQVAGAGSWSSVSAGYDHIIAVDVSYNLWAWGNSASISVAPYYSWSQVATGGSHIIAVRNDGKLFAWGLNNVGQLGDGTTVNKSSPVQVGTNLIGTSWSQVFAGDSHSVAIANNNLLYSWGLNNAGQLGIGNTTNQSVPIVVAGTTTPIDNSGNAYVLTNVGVTYMTTNSPFASPGATGYSQYFDGSSGYVTLPSAFNTAMVGLASSQWTMECWVYITAFNASNSYSSSIFGNYQGVAANGRWLFAYIGSAGITGTCEFTYTTGTGSQVNLQGNSTFNLNTWTHLAITIDATTPSSSTIVMYVNGVGQTFTGNNLSTQTSNYATPIIGGNIQYWNNTLGYISNLRIVKGNIVYVGNFTPPTSPLTATQSISGTNISAITAGQTLLLTEQQISNLASWNQVGAGVSYTLARRSDNLLFSWGTNSVYQLGLGTTIAQSSPVQVGVNSWTQISAGYDHALAIDSSTRNMWIWGNIASTFNLSVPYSWTQVSEGLSHTLAIRSDSTLWVWGSNSYGQVGSGNTISYSSPVQIGSPVSWSQIFAGDLYSTAITTNNLLYTWGYNVIGQLGTGDTINRLLPTPVTGTSVLTDASSNAFPLTKIGTTYTVQQIAPFSGTYSQYFDGSTGTISIPNASAITLNTGSVPTFTIELWFYSSSPGNNLIDKGSQAGVSIPNYRVSCGTNVSFLWGPGSGSTFSTFTTSGININTNTWYHVAVVSNAGNLNIYVNGVSYATGTLPSYGDNGDPLFIGSRFAGDQFYQGYISNLRIVKGLAVYTGNFTVPTTPLTATQSAGTNISAITAGQTSLLTLQKFPGTIQSWSQVSAGTSFTLALRNDKTLWGWGLNSSSQLGTGDTFNRILPVPITGTSIPTDSSTNTFTLTKVGVTYPNTIYSPFATPGTTGYSQYFDGSTGYLTVPSNAAFNFGSGAFTVECWSYITTSIPNNTVYQMFQLGNHVGAGNFLEFGFQNSSGTVSLYANLYNNGYKASPLLTVASPYNSWAHCALIFTGSTYYISYNGVLSTGVSYSGSDAPTGQTLYIGYYVYASPTYFAGYISNYRVVKGLAVYTGNFTPPTNPLTLTQSSGTNISAITAGQTSLLTLQTIPGTPLSWTQVVAGYDYATAIRNDKTLWGWGNNNVGQLGTGDTFNRTIPSLTIGSSLTTDASTNALVLTRTGTTYMTTAYTPFASPGTTGYGGYFDGSTGYLTVPPTLFSSIGTSDFTVEAWVYATAYASVQRRIWSFQNTGSSTVWNLYQLSTGQFSGELRSSAGTSDNSITGTTIALPYIWYHVAFVRASGTTRLFVNGNQEATATSQTQSLGAGVAEIGGSLANSNYFPGYISNLRVLASLAVYTGNFTVPTTPLASTQSSGTNISAITGTQTTLLTLQTMPGTSQSWSQISAGQSHTVAIRSDNTLWSWGLNNVAQLGYGDTLNRSSPVQVGSFNSWTQVIAGVSTTSGVMSNYLFTWGLNTTGQLGLNNLTNKNFPILVSAALPADASTNAITAPLTIDSGPRMTYMSPFATGQYNIATYGGSMFMNNSSDGMIASSSNFAINASAFSVECWVYFFTGSNGYVFSTYVQLSSPGDHGTIFSFGTNGVVSILLKLNNSNVYSQSTTNTMNLNAWNHILVARNSGGTISMYINGTRGFTGSNTYSVGETTVGTGVGYAATNTSGALLGLISNLRFCIGTIPYDPTLATITVPTTPLTAVTGTQWLIAQGLGSTFTSHTQVASNGTTGLAIRGDGSLWAWGNNPVGQFGNNNVVAQSSPVQVGLNILTSTTAPSIIPTNQSWNVISAGQSYSLAIRSDNTLWAWGLNSSTQLGLGDTLVRSSPTQIGSLNSWTSVSANYATSAGIQNTWLHTWGLGTTGQLGTGDATTKGIPILSGTPAPTDASSNAYAISIGGTPKMTDMTPFATGTYNTVTYGGSMYFNGSNSDNLLVGSAPAVGAGGFSVEAFIYYYQGSSGYFYSNYVQLASPGDHGVYVYLNTNGTLFTQLKLNNGSIFQLTTTNSCNLNAWNHVLLIRDASGNTSLYINGVRGATGTNTYNQGEGGYSIGSYYYGQSGNFTGLISNLRFIVGSTLPYSATAATITVPTTPLTAVTGTALLTLQFIGANYQSFSKVSVGSSYVTANRNDGAFLAWGYNAYGQIGVIDTINRSSPTLVAGYNTPQQITNLSIWNTTSAGFSYTMGIQSNGTLWAWGLNTSGQLGTGDTLSRVSITQVGAGSWLQISAGNYTGSNTTYGIATNFGLYAWGNNNVGQVLDGTTINKSSPVQIGTSSWTSVSAGASTGGAILSNGVAYNWGLGTNGTIGNNTVNTYSSPVVLGNIPASSTTYPNKIVTAQSWSLVTASYSTSYAIRADKTLWSWGINASGQLGVNNAVTYSSPVQIGTSSWTQISTTNSTVGAIRSDYTLWMWGYNGQGQLGNNTTVTYSSPIQIGASWLAVSVGYNTTLAISNTSQLYVWGQSTNGELGNNTVINLSSPVQLGTRSWTSLGAGGNTSAAVRNDGLLFLWGLNTSGQLGDLTVVSKSSPVILGNVVAGASSPIQVQSSGTFNSWINVTAGTNYTLGIDTAYRLWVWGFNSVGQLGDGTTDSKYSPVLMSSASWLSLSAGVSHTLAIDFTNSLYAWGLNNVGQLGTGTTINYSSPVQVAGPASYQKISAGNSASAAISMNNNLYAWGNNSTAMLGTGDTINRSSPTLIGTSFNQVSVGGSATVATLINRTMYTWGTNASGVLAQNNTISYSSPVLVGPFSFVSFSSPVQVGSLSWISVASGLSHMAAVRSDGLLFAWGVNTGGQLGNNTAISYSSPIQIGTSSWTQVAAGQSHTLAIRSDKTLWGWGLNSSGQLGNSSTVTYSSPVQIGASLNTSWSLVTAGASHTVVIDTNKVLWVWGNNASGQLGTRDAVNRSGPTQVNITADASVNNFVLTRFGNTYMTNSLIPFAVPGANTNSGFFDGVSTYLNVPTSNSITFGSGSFTIEFWMYSTSTANSRMFGNVPNTTFAANQWAIAFNYNVANTVSLIAYNFSSSTPILISSATNLNNGVWHHVAIVRNGSTFTMFVDGTSSATNTYSGVIDAGLSNPLVIGTTGVTGDSVYSGYLSNLRVVKGLAVYTGTFAVPTTPLATTQTSSTNISAITGTQTSLLTLQNLGANASWNSVGSGQNHTIALDSSSHIWGWGLNSVYQVGDNTLINRSSPVLVSSLSSWTQVTAGTDHSLAIGADGSMWVWGNNNQGQLGLGNGTNTWKQVVEGQSFTAGISSSGQLFTWGYNNVGQLGTGDTFNRSSPVLLGTSTSWTNIIAGASHLAAIDASGNLWMWGNNATGQLGDGTYINKSSPVLVASSILAVGTGTDHTLALNTAGKLFGWGNNSSGQTAAYTIPYSWTVISESTTGSHTVAIRSDSTLWAWGLNSSGQLGIGNTINQSSPIQVGTSSWTAISVGASHTMAINGFGLLYGWGNNSLYQVGDGTSINKSIPVQIGTSSWTAVSAGQNHTLAITSTFLLYAWGQGTTGQLGTLTTAYSWNTLSAGATHATAIRGDGTTWTWGLNTSGQLGTLTTVTYSSPVQVGTSFVKIASGNNHSLAINNTGALFGWGINGTYQLGTGDIISRSSPVQISTSSFSLVSAGYSYSGAISSTGALYMWGLGTGGQLGYSNYFTGTFISPTPITTFVSWTQLSLGYDHVAGIDTLGRLYTWGIASSIGLYVQPQSWTSISSGKSGAHVLAIRSDNTLWSWGNNSVGQLGTGDILTRSSPVQVGMLMNNWASISAGDSHSIAINSNNRIYAWGLNSSGQLGDGSTINKPVAVLAGVANAQTDASAYNYGVNVYSGSPRITEFSPFATFNSTGNSVYFNGTYSTDGYQVPTGVNFQFTTGVAFTIEAWVYLVPATAGYRAIFDSRTTVNNVTGLFIGLNNSTNAWTIAYAGGSNFVVPTTNLNYYQWQHIAVVRNTSNVMTAYWNGINVGSATVTQTFTDGGCLIGRTLDGVPWNGYISNFRIVNGVAVYTGNFTVPTTPLTATQSAGVNISAITNQTVLLTCQTLGANQYSWTQVSAGTSYSVARRSDNTLWAWGNNSVYQLGLGNTFNKVLPMPVGGSSVQIDNSGSNLSIVNVGAPTITQISPFANGPFNMLTYTSSTYFDGTASYLTLYGNTAWALGTTGTIECWIYPTGNSGGNVRLFCVNNTTTAIDAYFNGATYNIYLHGGTVGTTTPVIPNVWTHLAIVYNAGAVSIYFNGVSQPLTGTTTGYNLTTTSPFWIGEYTGGGSYYYSGYMSNIRVVKGVAVYTGNFTVSTNPLTATQSANVNGSPSAAITTGQTVLLSLQNTSLGTTSWTQVNAGHDHVLAIDSSTSNLWTWGNANSTFALTTPYSWSQLSAGASHVLAIRNDNTLWSWGYNLTGQLGDGTSISKSSPVQVVSTPSKSWNSVYAGDSHSVAIDSNNLMYAWGLNASGQLGLLTNTSTKIAPVLVNATVATDASTNNYTLTNVGASMTNFSPFINPGTTGFSGVFNGSSDYYLLPAGASSTTAAAGAFTIEAWVYSTAATGNAPTIASSWYNGSASLCSWVFNISATNTITFSYGIGSTNSGITGTSQFVLQNAWYHVAIVRNSSNLVTLYVNGVADITTATIAGTLNTNSNGPKIGSQDNSSHGWLLGWQGYISNFRFVNGTAVYTSNFTPSLFPLTATQSANVNGSPSAAIASGTAILTMQNLVAPQSWSQVTAGASYTMARRSDSTLWGWGINNVYQLGIGDALTRSSPVQVGTSSWYQVSAGFDHTLAIDSTTRNIYTWGNINSVYGFTTNYSWTQVATSGNHSLAIRSDGSLWTWGLNSAGQLGNGATINQSSPVQVGTSSWSQIYAGDSHSVGITITNYMYAWGLNASGQLGNGTTVNQSAPAQIGLIGTSSWTQVTAGVSFTMARRSDSTLWAWGLNSVYQLGIGTTINQSSPIQIGTSSWSFVSAGVDHSVAIDTTTSNLWTWGNVNSIFTLTTPYSWTQVSEGLSHTLAIRSDSTLWSWGNNASGQLGDGTSISKSSPVQVGTSSWTSVAAGDLHSVGISATTKLLFAWGNNATGQLGTNNLVTYSSPVQIGTSSWASVSAGLSYTLGITISPAYKMYAWGVNGSGQLGDGTSINKSSPVQIGSSSWTQVSASKNNAFVLAISSLNLLYGWGVNGSGQLGTNNTVTYSSPVQIGTSSWTQVAAGFDHAVGVTSTNQLFAWGTNASGQLGQNNTLNYSIPMLVANANSNAPSDASSTNTIISKVGNTYMTGSTTPFGTLVTNGYSQYFDGGSYLTGTLTTPTSATAFTIEAWVYLTGYPGSPGGGIMSTSYTATTPYGWYLNVRSTGYVSFNETWGASGFASTNQVPLNQWVHIAATRNGATAAIYINGVPNGTGTFSQTYTSTQFVIGRDYVGSSIEYFGGYISNLRYVNNVVVYTGAFTPSSSPLTVTQTSGTNISAITTGQTQLLTLQNIGTIQSWSQVSAGTSTTYAVRSDNTLWAWGINSTGQLGQTFITISLSSPVQVGTSSWTQISVASSTITAISSTNQLFAWGNNASGQLGTNDILSRSSPTQVRNLIIASSTPVIIPTSQSWLAVSAGNSFATAIRNDNTLWSWGLNNAAYQLGLGDTLNRYSPSQIGSLNSWTQIKSGISFASGIMNNYLFNWGLATTGQGGNYATVASIPVPMIEGANIPTDASAYNNTFTVGGAGGRMTYMSPFATGQYNIATYGGSGIFGANGAYMYTSHPLLNIGAANSIWMFETWILPTPSTNYFFAVGNGGAYGNDIYCGWSSNAFTIGQGTGSSNINVLNSPPIYPPNNWYHYAVSKDATGFIRLFINGNYVAGVLNPTSGVSSGTTLVLNGLSDSNGLGGSGGTVVLSNMRVVIGNPVYTVPFTPPTGPLTATQSANVNGSPSAAITAGQTVILTLQGLTGQTNWNQVSTLYSTTVGIGSTGQLYAWGNNATGQVGDNTTVTRSSPVQVRSSIIASSTPVIIPTSQSWNIVSAGISYSAAIRNDNTLWMWGQNTVGQLGVSAYGYYDTIARSSPSQVPGSYTAVKAGNSYTYAVTSSGTLFAWGYNGQGQLGNSTTVNYSSPVQIGVLSWNQLGSTIYSSPTQIGTSSWTSVGIGIAGQFGAAIRSDGAMFAWGNNTTYGQLGINNTISQSSPIQVRGLASVVSQPTQISTGQSWLQVSAGVSHSGAINSSNTLWLWGLNNVGQLATGDTINRNQPTQLGVSSWTSVTAGNSFTLGIQSGNVPFAWGLNTSAQLSDYTVVSKSSPVNVGTVIILSNQNAFGYTTAASTYGGWPISNTSTLNFAAGQAFTVEMWVYPTIASNGTYFFNWGTYKSAYSSEYVMNIGYTGANIYISGGSNTSTTGYSISYPGSVTLNANTWYHIALVRTSSSVVTLYLNGVGGTPVTVSGAAQPLSARYDLAGPNGMWFGVNITNWTAFSPTTYTGYISNFRYVLGNAVYTGNFTVPTSPLTATQSSGTNISAITAGQTQLLTFDAPALTQLTADSVAFTQTSGLFSTSNSVLTYTPSSFTGITLINGSLFYGTQVATGVSTGYAVSSSSGSSGTLFGWGAQSLYQLGLNNATTYSSPIQIGNYQYLNTGTLAPAQIQGSWSAVSAGQSFTLAITSTGTLYGWGLNTSGQLGTYDSANRSSPTQISTLSWSSVSAGYSHAGAITSVNTLYMWGSGGVTPAINTSSPTQITSGSNSWSQVSAGQSYTLARDINGLLYGWGQDSSGQLGIL